MQPLTTQCPISMPPENELLGQNGLVLDQGIYSRLFKKLVFVFAT